MKLHSYKIYMLLVIALFIQALIPQGFMPNTDADGFFELSICRSSDIGNTSPVNSEDRHEKDMTCPFMVVSPLQNPLEPYVFKIAELKSDVYDHQQAQNQLSLHAPKTWQAQAPPTLL